MITTRRNHSEIQIFSATFFVVKLTLDFEEHFLHLSQLQSLELEGIASHLKHIDFDFSFAPFLMVRDYYFPFFLYQL